MGLGGIMHRVTPDHYNLYDEEERLVGTVSRVPREWEGKHTTSFGLVTPGGWYGRHGETHMVTGVHAERHNAARDLLDIHHHHDPNVEITDPDLDDTGRYPRHPK